MAEPIEAGLERKRKLAERRWVDQGYDGLFGYVHVDELEKIEGPPPEGVF